MINIRNYSDLIEQEIKKQKFGKQPASLYEPIRYLMGLGGKRMRPLLTLLAYSLYKDNAKEIVPHAVAVEAFHNFTLMHDDIMDKAPLRRGNATVHEKWNVNTAILSGDVMLVKVYEKFSALEGNKLKKVLNAFNDCATQVCEGQQRDMEFETTNSVKEAQYIDMIRQKTAVLLGFSLELGAILADAPVSDQRALRDFGINIGIGFQLKDDLLDACADPKKFGKQVGGDIIANKKTYLLIKALEKAKGKQKKELTNLISAKKFNKQAKVKAVKAIYESLNIYQLTEKKVNHFFDVGFDCFEELSANPEKKAVLAKFAQELIARQA
jgi:geranylgeranyl diphosphate synthase type II